MSGRASSVLINYGLQWLIIILYSRYPLTVSEKNYYPPCVIILSHPGV